MDPITVIVTALAAGASLGVKDTTSAALKDAYTALKNLTKQRFAGRPTAEMVLREYERAPETWQAPLADALRETGADQDALLIAAAKELLRLADERRPRAGKYVVDVRNSRGVLIGDNSEQHNDFDFGNRDPAGREPGIPRAE